MYFCKDYNYGEKADLTKSYKKNVGNHAFTRDNKATIILKTRENTKNVCQFVPNLSSIISEKCVVTPNFLFWIVIAHAKICFFHVVISCAKTLLYYWANSLRNPNIPRCAERMRSNKSRHRPFADTQVDTANFHLSSL